MSPDGSTRPEKAAGSERNDDAFGSVVTVAFPLGPRPALRAPGRTPRHQPGQCDGVGACAGACPNGALRVEGSGPGATVTIDYGLCLFCGLCVDACASGALESVAFDELAVRRRSDLISIHRAGDAAPSPPVLRDEVAERIGRLFAGSLAIREVDAGSCNGCEVEVGALTWPRYDLERLGIRFVASPRHADALLVTGPVTRNMRLALLKTHRAMPGPSIVLAVGACGIAGGPFVRSPQVENGVDQVVPVEVYVPGCPPSPMALLYGLWLALGKVDQRLHDGEFPFPAGEHRSNSGP
ncbi:MAG: NADH-quinone oxidoreductase subunit NuoB [Thermoplasmata archaeon]|nr:NADH-quinone oxidoreductase subunit NuoB [Thermoplasmata archaeon]